MHQAPAPAVTGHPMQQACRRVTGTLVCATLVLCLAGCAAPLQLPAPPAAERPTAAVESTQSVASQHAGEASDKSGSDAELPGDATVTDGPSQPAAATNDSTSEFASTEIAISSDGRYVLLSRDNIVTLWDVSSHRLLRRFDFSAHRSLIIAGMVFTADARQMRLIWNGSAMTLHDLNTGKLVAHAPLISANGHIGVTDVSEPSQTMQPPSAKISDFVTGRKSTVPVTEGAKVLDVSASGDALLTLMAIDTKAGTYTPREAASFIADFASQFAPGLGVFAGEKAAGIALYPDPVGPIISLVVWDVARNRRSLVTPLSAGWPIWALSDDGHWFALENDDKSIDSFELPSGKKRRVVNADSQSDAEVLGQDSIALSQEGKWLARTRPGGVVEMYDLPSGRQVFMSESGDASPPGVAGGSYSSLFSPDGKLFASRDRIRSRVSVWESATGRMVLHESASAIALGPDGHTIVLGLMDQGSPVWRVVGSETEKSLGEAPSAPTKPDADQR